MQFRNCSHDSSCPSCCRLYQTKTISEGDEGKLERVQLKFDENGKEVWTPVKTVSSDEQKEYLCNLYSR
jgi:ribosomal protein S8